mmetsp:Transcript_10933/g.17524  ORF Transcript_10933/g.17524 Transcript_10933/m.17524 type:complete len:286 (-) Transcript_10933:55-912(-)
MTNKEHEHLELVEPLMEEENDDGVLLQTPTERNNSTTNDNKQERPKQFVKLVAPSDLPQGYRLPVKYRETGSTTNTTGFARIPEGGVRRGQEIQAAVIPPQAIMGRWTVGEFDCGSNRDAAFTTLSCFCTPMAWACLYESAFHRPAGSCWIIVVVLTVVYWVCRFGTPVDTETSSSSSSSSSSMDEMTFLTIVMEMISWALLITTCVIRGKIRQKFHIPGNACQDCICVTCCGCCTAIQAYQHLARNHENPKLCPGNEHDATLVVVEKPGPESQQEDIAAVITTV